MEIKEFLDFLPTNFRHEKSFFLKNNLTEFEKLSSLSDLDINEIQRKSSLCSLNNLKKIRAIAIFKKKNWNFSTASISTFTLRNIFY